MTPESVSGRLPLVSVITPCLNPGATLLNCLDSVKGQSYPRVEHVIVDGGSDDGTLDIVRSRPGLRWVSEPDGGQSEALNRGFEMAKGEIVTWLNADDTFFPWTVEVATKVMQEPVPVEWVYGACEIVDAGYTRLWFPPSRLTETSFDHENVVPQPGCFFTSRALRTVGGIDDSLHLAMDYDLWIRFLDAGMARRFAPQKLAVFHIHESSKTGSRPYSDFLVERAIALSKSGRWVPAGVMLGRAATQSAWTSHRALDDEITRLARAVVGADHLITREQLKAGALTELALGRPDGRMEVSHLLSATPWRYRQTRKRIRSILWKRVRTLLRLTVGRSRLLSQSRTNGRK